MNILLIAGGWSSEREISLSGAKNIAAALEANGHNITFFDLQANFNELAQTAARHDFAFLNLHGAPGEDGIVQAILDAIPIPYQGSGPAGSFLALNKAAAKQIFRKAGLPTADWQFLPVPPPPDWQPSLLFPLFVKGNTSGSSLHCGRATNIEELRAILNEIFSVHDCALLEPEIRGKEVQCGILGSSPLPPILIEPLAGAFFDFKSKYAKGGAREICPAPITREQTAKIQELALAAHKSLGLTGYSRADFILDTSGNFTLLEVNTLPGMTATSLIPQEAAVAGISFPDLLEKLIELGIADCQKRQSKY